MSARQDMLELDARPDSVAQTVGDVWRYRHVLVMLARTDFHARYKRASFGVSWAVAVPLLQTVVMAVVFSHVVRLPGSLNYPIFVMSGVLPWSYFSSVVSVGGTGIVDGTALTDKVWFPRALLPTQPALANLVALGVTMVLLVLALPVFGEPIGLRTLLLIPACMLLFVFTTLVSLVLAALHVYFRDVRFLVQAGLILWFYATPVIYPVKLVGRLQTLITVNPLTGVISLFHLATTGGDAHWERALLVTLLTTVALAVIAVETYRRYDRLFVDRL
jgi:ABC-type polysaccharide/polyol phosphate export permease